MASKLLIIAAVILTSALCRGLVAPDDHHAGTADDFVTLEEHRCIHDEEVVQRGVRQAHEHVMPQKYSSMGASHGFRKQAVGPIRIIIRTPDLDDSSKYCSSAGGTSPDFSGNTVSCTEDTVFSAEKKTNLTTKILPAAVAQLSSILSVDQLTSNLMVSSTSTCQHHTIPSDDVSTGVASADFVLYVSAGPTQGTTVAWAGYCQLDQNNRPVVGRANFSPKYITWDDNNPTLMKARVSTAVHEILHAFGFSYSFIKDRFVGSATTISPTTVRGKSTEVVTTTNAVAKAKDHFGCTSLAHVELEDEGGSGTAKSHWDRRNHYYDVMAGSVGPKNLFSDVTAALLQDSGHYTVNFGNTEAITWGKGAGCNFLDQKCDSSSSLFGKYWCSELDTNVNMCNYDYSGVGYCATTTHASDLETYFRYFTDAKVGGSTGLMDYCPFVRTYSNRICEAADEPPFASDIIYGYTYGPNTRCAKVNGVINSSYSGTGKETRCLKFKCPDGGSRVQFQIRGSAWTDCPSNGAAGTVNAPAGWKGTVDCPAAAGFCTGALVEGTAPPTPAPPVTPPPPATTTAPSTPTPQTTAAQGTPAPPSAATCDSEYLLPTDQSSPSTLLSVHQINGILTEHNNARRVVNPKAKVMPMLKWSQGLADFAQNYMDGCPGLTHSSSAARRNIAGHSYIGENLAAGTSNSSYGVATGGVSSTAAWNRELTQDGWVYPTTCSGVCGHYTQVIWANTLEVGCGFKYCPNQPYKNYWSCVYGPGGNYNGQAPYQEATATETATCQIAAGSPTPAPYTPGPVAPQGPPATPSPTAAGTPSPSTTTAAPGSTPSSTSTNAPASSGATSSPSSSAVPSTSPRPTDAETASPHTLRPDTPSPVGVNSLNFAVVLSGTQWSSLVDDVSKQTTLRTKLRSDFAQLLRVSVSQVVITNVRVGSLEVNATLVGTSHTETTAREPFLSTDPVTAKLPETTAMYGAQTGESTDVTSTTVQAVGATSSPGAGNSGGQGSTGQIDASSSDGCVGSCIAFVIVIIVVIFAIIAAVVVVVIIILRNGRSTAQASVDSQKGNHNDPYYAPPTSQAA